MKLARLFAWWLALAATFMLFTGEWTAVDLAWAGPVSLVVLTLVGALQKRRLLRTTWRWHWLRSIPAVALQVFADFGIVVVALTRCVLRRRRHQGAFVARDFPAGGATTLGGSWRAFVTFAATLSPNSYVVDIDREGSHRLSHDLVPHRASERPA